MYVDGLNFRRIGCHLGVNHQTVINWVNAQAERTPAAPVPASVRDVEMDKLFTFIGDKKTVYVITFELRDRLAGRRAP